MIRHHWYDQRDLEARPLTKELLTNPKFRGVECVYPNIDFEMAFGSHAKSFTQNHRQPRNLQPNPIYFDNQEAATTA